ncbi:mCG148219 [Mus musculus]|nr:mCG148219 [Mus musculus]
MRMNVQFPAHTEHARHATNLCHYCSQWFNTLFWLPYAACTGAHTCAHIHTYIPLMCFSPNLGEGWFCIALAILDQAGHELRDSPASASLLEIIT